MPGIAAKGAAAGDDKNSPLGMKGDARSGVVKAMMRNAQPGGENGLGLVEADTLGLALDDSVSIDGPLPYDERRPLRGSQGGRRRRPNCRARLVVAGKKNAMAEVPKSIRQKLLKKPAQSKKRATRAAKDDKVGGVVM